MIEMSRFRDNGIRILRSQLDESRLSYVQFLARFLQSVRPKGVVMQRLVAMGLVALPFWSGCNFGGCGWLNECNATAVENVPDTDFETSDTAETGEDTYDTGDDTDMADYTLLFAGPFSSNEGGAGPGSEILHSVEEYNAYLAEAIPSGGIIDVEIDFETTQVLVASHYVSSTCELHLDGYNVENIADTGIHLEMYVTDTSGDCEEVCDAEGTQMVMVVVGNDRTGSTSVSLENDCL